MFLIKQMSYVILAIILFETCTPQRPDQEVAVTTEYTDQKDAVVMSLDQGKKIYDIYCLMCHGEDGKRVLTGYYDLAESELDLKGIVDVTSNGRNAMVSYRPILNDDELKAVSAYTLTLQGQTESK